MSETHIMRDRLSSTLKKAGANVFAHVAARPQFRRILFNALRLRRPEIMTMRADDELRFLAHVFERIERSKSQILQDLWVCFELGDIRNGYFVEFGATDGLTNSNTWLLENDYGWRGILAEPNPVWHGKLDVNRRCVIDKRCVYTRSADTVTFVAPEDPELGGIYTTSGFDHFAEIRQAAKPFDVPTVSLDDLLDQHGAPDTIDYMSIDTEGSELDILRSFDMRKRRIRLLSVEHSNSPQEPKIDQFLSCFGYRRRFPDLSQWDGWYVLDT